MDIHLFSRHNYSADQALHYRLALLKGAPLQIVTQELPKSLRVVYDLLPMHGLLLRAG
jgi:hypothetical protein